ncbi:thiamine diphosphokinase [Mucilaginibacter sp.]|jgi:thiamine pyrophosphokinase|uniref:thiamine diphosphokinase n=1 Tax=Mucilaginibacter sp. TaxID=1882438 RepID=UPI003561DA79
MSSHHIVREKQEPALLVLGLDNFSDEMLGQLLEWSPTLITTPLTAEQINSQGIKVDIIIADGAGLNLQSDVRLIPAANTPIKAALDFLLANDYKAVNIVTDNVTLNEFIPYADKINLVIFSGSQKIYPVTPGFSKWKPAGELIEILSVADSLEVTGLEPMGNKSYRTILDGFFTLRFDASFLFIAEDI